MKMADWVKAQKKKRAIQKRDKLERKIVKQIEELRQLDADNADIVPPKSRLTDEYLEFLKQQQAADATRNIDEQS